MRTVNGKKPRRLRDVRNLNQAQQWLNQVSRNISPDLMERIQNGALAPDEKDHPKVRCVAKAWTRFLHFTGGAFVPVSGGTLHHPV